MTFQRRTVAVLVVLVAALGMATTAGAATSGTAQSTETPATNAAPLPGLTAHASGELGVADELVDRTVATVETAEEPPLLAPLLAYSRSDDSDPMAHETRQAIYDAVVSTPGIHLAGVAERIDVPASTVTYHSRVLDEEGLLDVHRMRGRTRLFPVSLTAGPPALDAALAEASTAAVLLAVRRCEPASVRTLADELDRAASTVSHHLRRLAADDLVERERDGEAVVTTLATEVRETLTARN